MIQIQSSTILNGPSTPERTITETSALRQTMPVHPIAPFFTPAAVALLRAAGANAGLSGIAHALPIIVSCVHAAAELWPNEPLKEWAEVTTEMARDFSVAKSTAAGISPEFFNRPENATKIFEQFISWQTPALSSGSAFETHALLGRAVIQSASACHVISGELMSGLQTLARARQGKTRGSRSEDWEQLIPLIWTRSDQLKQAQLHSSKKSPVSGFLAACVSVLNAVCAGPILIGNSPSSQPENQSDDYSENDQFTSRNSEKTKAMSLSAQGTDDEDDEEGIPDIKYRLNAADWTSFGEKLGLYHRDQMLMDDLVEVTQKLPKFTKNGSLKEKGFAVLATLSLVTGCTDTVALQLQLHPMHSIWLDLSRGSWAWDFSVYRESKGHLIEPGSIEPIFCAWPSFLDPLLNAAVRQCPEAKTLEDLVLSIQDKEHFDLKSYRQFLRTCGHPSHPPYRGRYARSLPGVYLALTGSDMTSAILTGFFAATAPAALYYFGPTYQELESRTAKVYAKLGFGLPSKLNTETGRAGCKKILEVAELRKGWRELNQEIDDARGAALKASEPDTIRQQCNIWMALLGTAFVIQSAHRATRMDCLTAGALLIHPDVMVLHDKNEGDRVQPRLVPKTTAIKKILRSAAECSKLMATSHESPEAGKSFSYTASDPVFRQWEMRDGLLCSVFLQADAVATTTQKFFRSAANFGRSTWVTYLDKDSCNRWLIRSLTGHTRDVTRTNGPYFDVPPLVMARRLELEMEKTGEKIFGHTELDLSIDEIPPVRLAISERQLLTARPAGRVPDPRTILEPLSVDTLVEWQVSDQIRKDLIGGKIDAPSQVLAVLHLLFIDQIPDGDLCITAITERDVVVRQYGKRVGLSWSRAHFIYPTWLPIQPTSHQLIEQINESGISPNDLKNQVCAALRQTSHCTWPTSHKACWLAAAAMGVSYRRLSYPPSMAGVSDLAVPAPCLSPQSLGRLLGDQITSGTYAHLIRETRGFRKKDDDARLLIRTLGKYASTTDRLGEKIKRAKLCLEELGVSNMAWSPYVAWVKDWVINELQRTREGHRHCYQISSIETYTSSLLTVLENISGSDDPSDWDDQEWIEWVRQTNLACSNKKSGDTDKKDMPLVERAANAIKAIVNSLVRRSIYVPFKVRELLGDSPKVITPHGSASACLISEQNINNSIEVMRAWNLDYPADFALSDMRATVSSIVPSRSGEISSLGTNCLTPGGCLVFERAGYDLHKGSNAVRVIPMTAEKLKKFKEKRDALHPYFGERPLLLRGDGSPEAGLRDERIAREWTTALKQVTGDPQARPHSVRAATLQNIAWPGWQDYFLRWASNEAGPSECKSWMMEQYTEYCRLSTAVSLAGQGDLRPAFGHYLSGWPMVFALLTTAGLSELKVGPAFLAQLGISPDTLRQARSRTNRQALEEGKSAAAFDTWNWLMRQLARSVHTSNKGRKSVVTDALIPAPVIEESASTISELVKLRYLTVRLLGEPAERAIEKVCIPFRLTMELDQLLPPQSLVVSAVTRGRQGPGDRSKAADITTALSDSGMQIMTWLSKLETKTFSELMEAFFRDQPSTPNRRDKVIFWREVHQLFPSSLSLCVRIGSKYLTTAEISAFNTLAPVLYLKADPRIGEKPVVSVHVRGVKNLVTMARLTAVARASCLALNCLRHLQTGGEIHAL